MGQGKQAVNGTIFKKKVRCKKNTKVKVKSQQNKCKKGQELSGQRDEVK